MPYHAWCEFSERDSLFHRFEKRGSLSRRSGGIPPSFPLLVSPGECHAHHVAKVTIVTLMPLLPLNFPASVNNDIVDATKIILTAVIFLITSQ
jgi:hypothetical protein